MLAVRDLYDCGLNVCGLSTELDGVTGVHIDILFFCHVEIINSMWLKLCVINVKWIMIHTNLIVLAEKLNLMSIITQLKFASKVMTRIDM